MAASLTLDSYLDGLSMATARLHEESIEAGLEAPVPTCPGWNVLQLLAHQGTVHRWATAWLQGVRHVDTEALESEGMQHPDPGAWLMAGEERLETVLEMSPPDLDVPFILENAGPPREAWARRQAHETVIHAVDALSSRLGGPPPADDVDIDARFATDGVDEILTGFLPRPRQELRTGRLVTLHVHTTDTHSDWTVRLSENPALVHTGPPDGPPDTTWSGTAVQLYLGLWNRGTEIRQEGLDVLSAWHAGMTITWG